MWKGSDRSTRCFLSNLTGSLNSGSFSCTIQRPAAFLLASLPGLTGRSPSHQRPCCPKCLLYRWKEKENRESKTKQNWKFPPKRRLEEHNCLSSESKLCFEDEFSFPMTAFLPIYLFIYLKPRIEVPSTRLQFSVGLVWLFCSSPLHHCVIRYMTWSKLPKLSYNTISLS